MRILLVQREYKYARGYCETPSVAPLILGMLAVECGHEVRLLHLDVELSFEELAAFRGFRS